eukprot:scaffold895_cov315-Pinguiococcus_pyrenoidosus.AAC.77
MLKAPRQAASAGAVRRVKRPRCRQDACQEGTDGQHLGDAVPSALKPLQDPLREIGHARLLGWTSEACVTGAPVPYSQVCRIPSRRGFGAADGRRGVDEHCCALLLRADCLPRIAAHELAGLFCCEAGELWPRVPQRRQQRHRRPLLSAAPRPRIRGALDLIFLPTCRCRFARIHASLHRLQDLLAEATKCMVRGASQTAPSRPARFPLDLDFCPGPAAKRAKRA